MTLTFPQKNVRCVSIWLPNILFNFSRHRSLRFGENVFCQALVNIVVLRRGLDHVTPAFPETVDVLEDVHRSQLTVAQKAEKLVHRYEGS